MTDAVLLAGDSYTHPNLYYTTHFLAGDPFIYIEQDGRALLVTSRMEQGRAQKESTVNDVRSFDDYGYRELVQELNDRTKAFMTVMARALTALGVQRARVESSFPVLYADQLRSDGISLDVDAHLYRDERRQKSDEEIEAIVRAQRATEQAVAHAIDILVESEAHHGVLHYAGIPLTSERLRGEIEVFLTREGMDASGGLIVAGGPGAADPHWEGEGALKAGEPIVLDVFPRRKRSRYFADMTRTVVKGPVGETLRAMYDAVLGAQEAGLREIRAGANGRDVHAAVEAVFEHAGFAGEEGPRYIHGTGHGIGLEIHEGPTLGSLDVELKENDVVTVEPGLYDPDLGAVRIEDLVVVTPDGYRNLTEFPKQLEL